ncbi:zinc finger protein 862-like [Mizuhopecten yessoensis]|uniref:zinc finger protein 862-like n=1 Tax=Mizuhopecten yessoensis TaxID=6573 RepID=UPI000B45A8B6|nr:zinc finger protein 862-like [Mizuhopecten yessoensis]
MCKKKEPAPLEKGFQKVDEQVMEKMDKLFRSAYYLVQKERPFSDFKDILELQTLNGLSIGETYFNNKAAKEFVGEIAGFYYTELKELLQKADYFSIFCDGSTDNSEVEKELIMVKVLVDFYPRMKFLKLAQPANTKAQGVLDAIDKAFEEIGLQDYKQKLVGFCSDGANVMMGKKKGVISLLKEQGNADWVLSVWCLAHRLELAIKDAFKQTYMDTVVDVLQLIFYFYRGSAKRNKEAHDIADMMEDHFYKPAKANGTRWVEHKLMAVAKLKSNWKVIVMHIMNYAEDNTNRGEDRAKAKGIIAKLLQYKFVWYMYFIKDVLLEITRISLLFQREDITVTSAVTKVQSAQLSLRDMINNPGPTLREFDQDVVGDQHKDHTLRNVVAQDCLKKQKGTILQDILDCIQRRMENLISEDPVYELQCP